MHSYKLLWLSLLLVVVVGCRKTELPEPAKPKWDMSLEPLDVVLRISPQAADPEPQDPFAAAAASVSEVVSHDEALGITVTRSPITRATPDMDEVIKDLNIFLFHHERDTVARHYYITNPNPSQPLGDIHLKNLYIGDYSFYVIANNGQSFCSDHDSEFGCKHANAIVKAMMSSAIPVSSSINLMTYTPGGNLTISRSDQQVDIQLQRLTARFDVKFVNKLYLNRPDQDHRYIALNNYTVLNVPVRTKLFASYVPTKVDLDNRIGVSLLSNEPTQTEVITLINNMQGSSASTATPSYRDRNLMLAPALASCLTVYATYMVNYVKQNISYHIYLGGPGEFYNNYDVVKGQRYQYTVTFNEPDFTDPRITSFRVFNETKLFSDNVGQTSNFVSGAVITRPLEIEYSTLLNNKLKLSCQNTVDNPPINYSYTISAYVPDATAPGGKVLKKIAEGKEGAVLEVDLPITNEIPESKMARTELVISYVQNETKTSYLTLTLKTSLGQIYQIRPGGDTGDTYQVVNYN